MTAAWLWARADLRARWRSWVVLGLLAGATVGLAAAAVAGARRTAVALPRYEAAVGRIDAAVLPNDPAFDAATRRRIAALPDVTLSYPFQVPFLLEVIEPRGPEAPLLPTANGEDGLTGFLVDGRAARSDRPDEVVIDENMREQLGLGIGSTVVMGQDAPPELVAQLPPGLAPGDGNLSFRARLRVVGVIKSVSEGFEWSPSSAFYRAHRDELVGPINMFVQLRRGEADFPRFQRDVQRIIGLPTNVERGTDLLGTDKLLEVTDLEEQGLLLFALAVVIGGTALVGQALIRAVNAGAADLPTWRALGTDRRIVLGGLVLPALVTVAVGAVTAVVVAIAASPRFPIGVARRYDLDPGLHADWLVLGSAVLAVVVAVVVAAWLTAEWRLARRDAAGGDATPRATWASQAGLPPAMLIGTRLAVEPGRGRRAVPVRSALFGAVVGVLGVVTCLTFRAGIEDAVATPRRSGVVWDLALVTTGQRFPADVLAAVARDRGVDDALRATWARAAEIEGVGTPTFGTEPLRGRLPFVVLAGRAPRGPDEVAMAPATLEQFGVRLGDELAVGTGGGRRVEVVGEALLPPTSHTDYDQGAWMTAAGLRRALPPDDRLGPDDIWDYALVRWRPGADVAAAERRLARLGGGQYYALPAELPSVVEELDRLRTLPLVLGVFFALLAAATVMHALVTTVRRRRHDLAVLRSIGLTRRQSRLAVAWQATLFALAGLVVGVPLGIVGGRVTWRTIADGYPLVYVPPLAAAAVLLVVPLVLVGANALAAGPARAAVRIRPAEALRVE